MERFIEFEKEVNMDDLNLALAENNPGIMILRLSKLTGTVKVRTEGTLTNRDIKRAFQPYKIKRIHSSFPLQSIKSL